MNSHAQNRFILCHPRKNHPLKYTTNGERKQPQIQREKKKRKAAESLSRPRCVLSGQEKYGIMTRKAKLSVSAGPEWVHAECYCIIQMDEFVQSGEDAA